MATGLSQYVRWDTEPDGSAPATAFGLGVTGGSASDADEPEEVTFAGGGGLLTGGMVRLRGSVRFVPTELAPLALALRPNEGYPQSSPPAFSVGYASDGSLEVFQQAKVNRLRLEVALEQVLQAEMEWLARAKMEVAPAPAVGAASGTPWRWYQFASQFNGLAKKIQGFTVRLDNGLQPASDLDGADAGERRLAKALEVGHERVSLELRTRSRLTAAERGNLADELAAYPAQFVATRGGETLTVALSGLVNSGGETPVRGGDGLITFAYTFRAAVDAGALVLGVA